MRRPSITIELFYDETNGADLRRRLEEYGIQRNELAREMSLQSVRLFGEQRTPEVLETQLSRWINDKGLPRIDNVRAIEAAILTLRNRRRQARRKQKPTTTE